MACIHGCELLLTPDILKEPSRIGIYLFIFLSLKSHFRAFLSITNHFLQLYHHIVVIQCNWYQRLYSHCIGWPAGFLLRFRSCSGTVWTRINVMLQCRNRSQAFPVWTEALSVIRSATLPFDLKRSFTSTRFRYNFCSDKIVQTWLGPFQKRIRYGTFHFQQQSGAVLFRSRNCFENSVPTGKGTAEWWSQKKGSCIFIEMDWDNCVCLKIEWHSLAASAKRFFVFRWYFSQ